MLNEFLPAVCDHTVVKAIMPGKNERKPHFQCYGPHDGDAYIPVEFSVAAYRFGHSMVRPSYSLNQSVKSGSATFKHNGQPFQFARIPIFVSRPVAPTDALNGFEALPEAWGIDWSFFFGTPYAVAKTSSNVQLPQPSYR